MGGVMTTEEIRELHIRVAEKIKENDRKLRKLENIQNILGPAVDTLSAHLSCPEKRGVNHN